jgi:hypothetical protein
MQCALFRIRPDAAVLPLPAPRGYAESASAVADAVFRRLAAGHAFDFRFLSFAMADAFGGTDAQGAWQWKDAYDAVEFALVRFLRRFAPSLAALPPERLLSMLEKLHAVCPTHARRSDESQAMQQFSTPLAIGLAAATAAGLAAGETVLEPSAGTGTLAVMAELRGARLVLNELAESRASLLAAAFPGVPVFRHNAEYVDDLLDSAVRPDAVVMNPPFSSSPDARANSTSVTLRHVGAALSRLKEGGRLVAVTGESFSPYSASWRPSFAALQERATLRYSVPVSGRLYAKHGTTVATRVSVFDKIPAADPARFPDPLPRAETALALLQAVLAEGARFPRLAPSSASPAAARPLPFPAPARPRPPAAAAADGIIELSYSYADGTAEEADAGSGDGVYVPYRADSVLVEGAQPHPSPLVQSAAMASVRLPKPSYLPRLPRRVVDKGILSGAQLESVIYAGEAHSAYLAGFFALSEKGDFVAAAREGDPKARRYRRGWYLGDGTGCGKGRQVAGILLDNRLQGRRKAVWISKSDKLLEDARRDWSALGGDASDVLPQWKFKQGAEIELSEGILFTTYATLRSSESAGKKSRLKQVTDWLGNDFDGCVIFDEAHAMANAASCKGSRGVKKASQQGLCGLKLQYALPEARVVYVSATGATSAHNLAYAERLGLWGTNDMPFDSQGDFVARMEQGGVAAMEAVARDLKALGLYVARSLSYEGVEYRFLEHRLTEEQIRVYDAYAEAFRIIHRNVEEALKAANVTSATGKTRNAAAKSAARSAFESNKQRFFNHLLMAMKCPSLIRAIEADPEEGHAAVVQIVSTNEALTERRLADVPASEWNDLDIDLTPREYVFDYLTHAFPVHLHSLSIDEKGQETSSLARDAEGNPVLCREAVRRRDALIEELAFLPAVPGALDRIVQHFGHEAVAECTGRSRRVIRVGSRYCVRNRAASANAAETRAFMNDEKRILVFSEAGGTGRSYHADRGAKNKRRRVHYLLEAGWKADAAVQGLGRTNRTNQVHAPVFRPVATDVKGEKRFLSTIARRLDTLGAITKGQRETGSQGLFREEDNLESVYARCALRDLLTAVAQGRPECCSLSLFEDATGLSLRDEEGALKQELPPTSQFLNRMPALPIALQNALFEEFEERIAARVEQAKEGGYYEAGVETLRADGFRLLEETVLFRHEGTGSATICNRVERRDRVTPLSAEDALRLRAGNGGRLMRNRSSGKAAVCVAARSLATEDGGAIARVALVRPVGKSGMSLAELENSEWEAIDEEAFRRLWEEEAAAAPKRRTSEFYLITGMLLPVWKKLPEERAKVCRLTTDDGRTLLGRVAETSEIGGVFERFGLSRAPSLSIPEILRAADGGKAQRLANGLELRRSLVAGNRRLEVAGFREGQKDALKAAGCLVEIVGFRARIFVPDNGGAAAAVARVAALA